MAWKYFRLSWFPYRERSPPQWCGHRGSKPTSGDGDTKTSPSFFTESQNTISVFHVKHPLNYLSFSVLVGAIDVPKKNRFGKYEHLDRKTGSLAWAGGMWNSAQRSHLYITGGTGHAWSFRAAPMAPPKRREFDFWHGFSRNKNTPRQRSASGSHTGDCTQSRMETIWREIQVLSQRHNKFWGAGYQFKYVTINV